ncbi:hypothetical protein RhiirA5_433948 [Rhizophagus irregularis]|uniref:Zinc finger mym-type protein 2-like: PROVISIONAL n=1 Tax=Rhizophagus irregularis TaxID=588596 RepID=A0A2N0NQW3_9GLOM|nr:hypothetical protein RhiirA5_433948 [Rhizophagus irregularis]
MANSNDERPAKSKKKRNLHMKNLMMMIWQRLLIVAVARTLIMPLLHGLIEQVDSKDELEDQLCHFIHAIKKQDGSDYHTSSLNNCLHSINHHLNEKSTLPKPINLLNKEEYYKLWKVYNAKVKNLASNGLGAFKGAEGFTEEELLQIINHPTMSVINPIANNIQAQGEKLYIPNIPEIIDMYELYFSKRPTQARTCTVSEKDLKTYMKQIASCTDINLNDHKISNHSGRKILVQILKRLNLSNAECMASSRHKSEQGLARY